MTTKYLSYISTHCYYLSFKRNTFSKLYFHIFKPENIKISTKVKNMLIQYIPNFTINLNTSQKLTTRKQEKFSQSLLLPSPTNAVSLSPYFSYSLSLCHSLTLSLSHSHYVPPSPFMPYPARPCHHLTYYLTFFLCYYLYLFCLSVSLSL